MGVATRRKTMVGGRKSRLAVAIALVSALGGVFAGSVLLVRGSSSGEIALADPDPAAPPPSVTATVTLEEPTSRPTLPAGGVGQDNPPGPEVMPDPNATPDITQSWWHIPYLNYDYKQPVENLTLNGISVGPDVKRASARCDADRRAVALEEVAGSRVGIPLSALPDDAIVRPGDSNAVLCGAEPIAAQLLVSLPIGSSASRFGGSLLIFRWFGEPQEDISIPAYRWSEGTVAGLPAAIAAPILPDLGLGYSAVLVYDGSVVTKIQASDVPLDDLLAIAEEVVR